MQLPTILDLSLTQRVTNLTARGASGQGPVFAAAKSLRQRNVVSAGRNALDSTKDGHVKAASGDFRQAKISNLARLSVSREEQVLKLDIAMRNGALVTVSQTKKNLPSVAACPRQGFALGPTIIKWQPPIVNNLHKHLATFYNLHNHLPRSRLCQMSARAGQ